MTNLNYVDNNSCLDADLDYHLRNADSWPSLHLRKNSINENTTSLVCNIVVNGKTDNSKIEEEELSEEEVVVVESDDKNTEKSDDKNTEKSDDKNTEKSDDTTRHDSDNNKFKPDILSRITYYMYGLFKNFRSSPTYKVLFHTTQPAHLILIIAITLVSALFLPFDSKKTSSAYLSSSVMVVQRRPVTSKATYLIYLTALSLHVGSQFWMTFVSGLSLYFNLARHAFGDVQRILFPRYFTLNCVLSAVILIQFGRLHERQIYDCELQTILQVFALSLCFLLELLIRLYLVPSVLELISVKTVIEKSAGVGQEVGRYELGPLLKCPHYMSIHKSFRKVHMCTAIGNIISMICSAFHLCYLANKWTHHLAV